MQVTLSHFKKLLVTANSAYKANNLQCSIFSNTLNKIVKYANTNYAYKQALTKSQINTVGICIHIHNKQTA